MCPRTSRVASSFRSSQSRCVTRRPQKRDPVGQSQKQGAGVVQLASPPVPAPFEDQLPLSGGDTAPITLRKKPSPSLGLNPHNSGPPLPRQDNTFPCDAWPHCPPP